MSVTRSRGKNANQPSASLDWRTWSTLGSERSIASRPATPTIPSNQLCATVGKDGRQGSRHGNYTWGVTRRTFLFSALAATAAPLPFPVIDTHIHLFDPDRPGGIPWPPPDDPIRSKPTYPERFRSVAEGEGVVGAVVVECSPRIEDNQWVLDIAANDRTVVGLVGFLDAGKAGFGQHLERFAQDPALPWDPIRKPVGPERRRPAQ